jgi:hypothetical protein
MYALAAAVCLLNVALFLLLNEMMENRRCT